MTVFELSILDKGRKTDESFAHVVYDREVSKEIRDKNFEYEFDDGRKAVVSVYHVLSARGHSIRRVYNDFGDYMWMVDSIVNCGKIIDAI